MVHGAWGGAWDWRRVDSLLTSRGHLVYRVTLTGLGERVHLASPAIRLETHIADVTNTLEWEELRDVVLVGHSYGGMVITGAADRAAPRVRHLVYVDAFLPDSGESVALLTPNRFAPMIQEARDGMLVPAWVQPGTPAPRDVPHPVGTFIDTLVLSDPASKRLPGTYILTTDPGATSDPFDPFAERAAARGWTVHRMTGDHVPERSQPEALVRLLEQVP